MPPTANPTVRPLNARVTQSPTAYHADSNILDLSNKSVDTDVVDISSTPKADEPGEETDDVAAFVAAERSFWNTSIISSNEASKVFTPLVIGAIAVAGVLVVVFAAVMFGLGQRLYHKRSTMNRGPEVNIKPGDKIQIDNLEDVVGPENNDEDAGFASNLMEMIFGSGVGNENGTMGPDGGGSTIISKASLKSAGSKMNSIIKSVTSKESTKKVLESIKKVQQKSFEATQNPGKAVKEATQMTAQDVSNLGDRVFSCASDVLCLPNTVQQPKQNSRKFNGRVPYEPKKNLEEAFFDDEISVYEDV